MKGVFKMFNPETMCELINSYNQTFAGVKSMAEKVKAMEDSSSEMLSASQNLKSIVEDMEKLKRTLKRTQILCEIDIAKRNSPEEVEELQEMLDEL